MTAALDTYADLRLAEGKLLRWGEREEKVEVALQARDLEILVALARYRFLTTGQIAELWWDGRGLRAVRRRMTRLFDGVPSWRSAPSGKRRPDPPTPEIPDPACAARGRGVHRFALDPPSSTCQINRAEQAAPAG